MVSFCNVHGQCGRNICCDLHMEQLNRVVKTAIEGLGANKTEKAVQRVGKCVGKFIKIMDAYDEQAGVASVSGTHNKKSFYLFLIFLGTVKRACAKVL